MTHAKQSRNAATEFATQLPRTSGYEPKQAEQTASNFSDKSTCVEACRYRTEWQLANFKTGAINHPSASAVAQFGRRKRPAEKVLEPRRKMIGLLFCADYIRRKILPRFLYPKRTRKGIIKNSKAVTY